MNMLFCIVLKDKTYAKFYFPKSILFHFWEVSGVGFRINDKIQRLTISLILIVNSLGFNKTPR